MKIKPMNLYKPKNSNLRYRLLAVAEHFDSHGHSCGINVLFEYENDVHKYFTMDWNNFQRYFEECK